MTPNSDIEFTFVIEKPKSGMWHCGPNSCWIIATHKPTMTSVRVYSGGKSQHQARSVAMDMLEYALASLGSEPCQMPELLK